MLILVAVVGAEPCVGVRDGRCIVAGILSIVEQFFELDVVVVAGVAVKDSGLVHLLNI